MNIKRFTKDRIADIAFVSKRLDFNTHKESDRCRILMYHSINKRDLREDVMGLAISPDAFYKHMKFLKEEGYSVIDLLDFVSRKNGINPPNEKTIVITFDDGYKSALTNALPVLKEFGFSATLFTNVYFIERKLPADLYYSHWEALDWDELRELKKQGLSIGAHGLTHRCLASLRTDEITKDVSESKRLIEKNINSQIQTFSYPHGSFDNRVMKILKNNDFTCSCSSTEGINTFNSDPFTLKRTEITGFDTDILKFRKKIEGCYDWLGKIRR